MRMLLAFIKEGLRRSLLSASESTFRLQPWTWTRQCSLEHPQHHAVTMTEPSYVRHGRFTKRRLDEGVEAEQWRRIACRLVVAT